MAFKLNKTLAYKIPAKSLTTGGRRVFLFKSEPNIHDLQRTHPAWLFDFDEMTRIRTLKDSN